MHDPTRSDMLAYIDSLPYAGECDQFDRESAVYWFAADWHGGQWSNLYAAMCASPYAPGPIANGVEPDSMASMIYDDLQRHYAVKCGMVQTGLPE